MTNAVRAMSLLFLFLFPAGVRSDAPDSTRAFHPVFPLLDARGANVLDSNEPVSATRTCGACHDVRFIEEHGVHAGAWPVPGAPSNSPRPSRAWDSGGGFLGRWNPIAYRMLTFDTNSPIDLSLPDWIRMHGRRHVGGGPAFRDKDGTLLEEKVSTGPDDPEASWFDPVSNRREPWDWRASGGVEMNCFLCHLASPDNESRTSALERGEFRWASTATLARTGLVERTPDGWKWNEDAFDRESKVRSDRIRVQDPADDNCGLCHGLVHDDPDVPLLLHGCSPEYWSTLTTGQIVSGQKLSDSGLNLDRKKDLTRAWDVHAERVVRCVDCHHAANNPIHGPVKGGPTPAHLRIDTRRLSMGEYLERPSHELARRYSSGEAEDARAGGACASCHDPQATHGWLPYWRRHIEVLSCGACHTPRLFAPARQVIDWTVLTPERKPRTACRGVESEAEDPLSLVKGFEPALLPRETGEGRRALHPYNLVTSFYWLAGDPAKPVAFDRLAAAYFDANGYRAEVLAAFDCDADGALSEKELVLDDDAKIAAVRDLLVAAGVKDPKIGSDVEPFPISHAITTAEWSTRECGSCHGENSRLAQPILLAEVAPGGVLPAFVSGGDMRPAGEIVREKDGRVLFVPRTPEMDLYLLGHDRSRLANRIGLLGMGAVLLGIATHGGLRLRAARRLRRQGSRPRKSAARREYMYTAYERLWHWLQALAVLVLIATGVAIHFAGRAPLLDFAFAVRLHNIIGITVVVNAALAAFFHLASGEIRQYLPDSGNFFSRAIAQTRYYTRGIFRGETHPFEKRPDRKLNPLQQATYLAILNVLLPMQTITGILIWSAQRWPQTKTLLGGLGVLAPLHAAGAWLFAAFLLMHVYLTTTGREPTTSIRAMIVGWEDVEGPAVPRENAR